MKGIREIFRYTFNHDDFWISFHHEIEDKLRSRSNWIKKIFTSFWGYLSIFITSLFLGFFVAFSILPTNKDTGNEETLKQRGSSYHNTEMALQASSGLQPEHSGAEPQHLDMQARATATRCAVNA